MADLSASYADDTAVSLDHIGIAGPDLNEMAAAFQALGFHLTPYAVHASGRTGNRCVMFRDGGYLELMAKIPGQSSTTLDRFLTIGPGAHSLALEVEDEKVALARLNLLASSWPSRKSPLAPLIKAVPMGRSRASWSPCRPSHPMAGCC